MSIAVSQKPLPDLQWLVCKSLNPVGALFTVSFADNTVMSVQPDGSVQHRPAGTSGAFELCAQWPQGLAFCPDRVHVYVFAAGNPVPNA